MIWKWLCLDWERERGSFPTLSLISHLEPSSHLQNHKVVENVFWKQLISCFVLQTRNINLLPWWEKTHICWTHLLNTCAVFYYTVPYNFLPILFWFLISNSVIELVASVGLGTTEVPTPGEPGQGEELQFMDKVVERNVKCSSYIRFSHPKVNYRQKRLNWGKRNSEQQFSNFWFHFNVFKVIKDFKNI